MSKLREAIKEARHTVNVCMLFWRKYTEWRDAHRDHTAVFIHVGDPDIVQALIKRSPRWQEFVKFEKQLAATHDAVDGVMAAARKIFPEPSFKPRVVGPDNVVCDCAACTASKATRSFDA
jgi:hypothetical protein